MNLTNVGIWVNDYFVRRDWPLKQTDYEMDVWVSCSSVLSLTVWITDCKDSGLTLQKIRFLTRVYGNPGFRISPVRINQV